MNRYRIPGHFTNTADFPSTEPDPRCPLNDDTIAILDEQGPWVLAADVADTLTTANDRVALLLEENAELRRKLAAFETAEGKPMFKIQLPNGLFANPDSYGGGSKTGKVWKTLGHVRQHLGINEPYPDGTMLVEIKQLTANVSRKPLYDVIPEHSAKARKREAELERARERYCERYARENPGKRAYCDMRIEKLVITYEETVRNNGKSVRSYVREELPIPKELL